MYSKLLKIELTDLAHKYGAKHCESSYLHPLSASKEAVIFRDIECNFHTESWKNIKSIKHLLARTKKVHSHFPHSTTPILEMQSSNSSDALAMNIFCHPDIGKWTGVQKLLNISSLAAVDFGFKAKVSKMVGNIAESDATEIDVYFKGEIIGECKLTEESFTSKDKTTVEQYVKFKEIFHIGKLSQSDNEYHNYQLIRNILAAEQHKCRFLLFCDMRRPDLARHFIETVSCIQDRYLDLRTNCWIIYWQDIALAAGKDLKLFLKEKYGI